MLSINWRRGELQLEVYVDVLFFWNVLMNLILLYITKLLRRQKTSCARIILGAIFGAFISCLITVFISLPSVANLMISYGFTGIIMVLIVFGKKNKRGMMNNYLYFLIVTFIFGGMLQSFLSSLKTMNLLSKVFNSILNQNISGTMMIVLLIIIIPLMTIILLNAKKKTKDEKCYYRVILKIDEKCIPCIGFMDTGNSLYDPTNGKPVILVDRVLLHSIYEEVKMNHPEKIRLVPYRCIGKENGLLEGIRMDEVTIENEQDSFTRSQITAALSEYEFKNSKDYQVLLHSRLLGNL